MVVNINDRGVFKDGAAVATDSEDLVRRLRKRIGDNLELGDHPALMEAEDAMLQAADLIEQLEREKAHKEKALEICKRLACQEGDEADTLARAFQIAHVIIGGRATPREQEFLDEALTIAKRRVNGE